MEDVKVREMQIFDYKKKIAEAETKLKQQQNLYEAVRSDRNLYSKNLIESQVRWCFIYIFRNCWWGAGGSWDNISALVCHLCGWLINSSACFVVVVIIWYLFEICGNILCCLWFKLLHNNVIMWMWNRCQRSCEDKCSCSEGRKGMGGGQGVLVNFWPPKTAKWLSLSAG